MVKGGNSGRFSRRGCGILLILAGTLVPLLFSNHAAQIALISTNIVSLIGYLLTIAGAAFLLLDSSWFAAAILCSALGIAVDWVPLVSSHLSEKTYFAITAVAIGLCYSALYKGLSDLIEIPRIQRMGQWWVALFVMSEVLMYVILYIYPKMPASVLAQLIGIVAVFLCAVSAIVFEMRYLLAAYKNVR